MGAGKSVSWPVGLGGKGNDGVAGLVSQNKGSIGYVELVYAISSKLPYATMRNSSNNFIVPSLVSSGLAAQIQLPDDLKVLLMNSSYPQAYPISAFTWLLVYREQKYAGRTIGSPCSPAHSELGLTTGQSPMKLGYGNCLRLRSRRHRNWSFDDLRRAPSPTEPLLPATQHLLAFRRAF